MLIVSLGWLLTDKIVERRLHSNKLDGDMIDGMSKAMNGMGYYLVIMLFIA